MSWRIACSTRTIPFSGWNRPKFHHSSTGSPESRQCNTKMVNRNGTIAFLHTNVTKATINRERIASLKSFASEHLAQIKSRCSYIKQRAIFQTASLGSQSRMYTTVKLNNCLQLTEPNFTMCILVQVGTRQTYIIRLCR